MSYSAHASPAQARTGFFTSGTPSAIEFEPVGGVETISVDTRVVLATNENLEKAVEEGRFRQDLFYRINVIHLELPSLRERPADIPLLVEHFLQKTLKDVVKDIEGFTPSAMAAMVSYSWPGNIRELENVVQRAVYQSRQIRGLPSLRLHSEKTHR